MKRQRSYGDGLDDDRRRFYDRGPPPPPPPRRPPREYDGDRFDRRKGFGGGGGGGGFHDGRYREYPSPREYGGDRAMHRSESFSGFRREFPKGFRSERDRSRRDGDGSSAWRRPGSGWRDAECFDEYRAPARLGAASMTAQPQPSRSRSRSCSPSEPRRRFEVAKAEKLKQQTAGVSEMEEGEVAPDAEPKARPAAVEHRKQVEPSRAKEKGLERAKVKKLDSGVPADLGTQGKGVTGAADPDSAGKEEGRRIDGMLAEAGKPIDKGSVKSLLKVEKEVSGGHEMQAQDVVTSDASKFGLRASPIQHEVLQEEVKRHEESTNSVDMVGQSTSSSILEVIQEATTREETVNDNDVRKSAPSSFSQGALQEEVMVLHKTGSGADDVGKSTSPIMRQEVMQEESLVLDNTANAVHEVEKSTSSGMPQEVLQEEVMQHDGTANAVDRIETASAVDRIEAASVVDIIETDTSSDLLREVTQEKMTILDETAHYIDTLEPVSYSGMLKEAIHEGKSTIDATGTTTGVARQSNSSDMAEDAVDEKAAAQEGTTNAVNSTGEFNTSTGLNREVIAPLDLQAPEGKEIEKLTVIGEMDRPTEHVAIQPAEEGREMDQCEKRGVSEETMVVENEAAVLDDNVEKQVKGFDIEANAASAHMFHRSTKEHVGDSKEDVASANLMTRESMTVDKGNGIAFDVLSKKVSIDHSSSMGRSLESALQLGVEPTETSKSASNTSVKKEDDTMKLGKLDLSLSLSGCLQNSEFKRSIPKTASLVHVACSQPLPSSFRTNSAGFTASISSPSSQTLGHNASCSLTQQSLDNYEHSVGSKPFFMGVDRMSNCTGRQAQLSSESTQKGSATPVLQRVLRNGHMPDTNTLAGIKGHNNGISNDLRKHANIPGILSPTHSRGSHDSGLEQNRHRRQLTRERSSNSLTRGERQEGEQLAINGAGVIERIIYKVVSEPLHLTGRMLQEMTENSITYLREAISDIIVDPDKRGQIIALQEALKKRADLNSDMLRTCPRVLVEILVAIRTGLPYFIKKSRSVATSSLVDIFLNLKCCNLSCQSILPVDDCDCKVCQRKAGFCSSCMCIVCSKFDSASNTCSWVGCDVCLHWCHTDCGLHHSLIRKGQSASRAYGTSEMQFHCAACGHPSEMFGFVKEVFRTCARQWRIETLIRELQYVERIFSVTDDVRGKSVRDFVKQMLIKLENKAYHPEVVNCVIAFFSDDDANMGINPSVPLKGIPCSISEAIDGIPSSSRKAAWTPFTLEGLPVLDKTAVLSTTGSPSVHRKSGETDFQTIDNKPIIDELDSLIRLKQAEAYMYQERANGARNEVDNLRRIVMVKHARIEEDYATQIADLDINELQERRKRKIEELQVIERTHHEFLSMKTRMKSKFAQLVYGSLHILLSFTFGSFQSHRQNDEL
ncbi:Protein OBERON 4 [Dichanthelium oligosanthes]|uniref:Protein OBERON 4 n=1 Tax=Dichanthelium oligosanthes TaxID=888268 RepID=A0A1E5VB86_9POAL|nr:Protein OBERON 4 [Dichanthelium oligosanthes]